MGLLTNDNTSPRVGGSLSKFVEVGLIVAKIINQTNGTMLFEEINPGRPFDGNSSQLAK